MSAFPAQMNVTFTTDEPFVCSFADDTTFEVSMGEAFIPARYQGETNIVPSADVQVLDTNGKVLDENITIQAIPNNYGLITYNGSTITVS